MKSTSPPSSLAYSGARALVQLLASGAAIGILSFMGACGDPTDRPEDCTINEYFDEGDRLCISCPALLEPQCRDGCGFVITEDFRGCPAAFCDDTCSLCDEGTSWSEETLACEVEPCAAGEYADDAGACQTCPTQENPPSDCDDSACTQCSLVSMPDERGCPILSCALCMPSEDGTATVDEFGRCEADAESP